MAKGTPGNRAAARNNDILIHRNGELAPPAPFSGFGSGCRARLVERLQQLYQDLVEPHQAAPGIAR